METPENQPSKAVQHLAMAYLLINRARKSIMDAEFSDNRCHMELELDALNDIADEIERQSAHPEEAK